MAHPAGRAAVRAQVIDIDHRAVDQHAAEVVATAIFRTNAVVVGQVGPVRRHSNGLLDEADLVVVAAQPGAPDTAVGGQALDLVAVDNHPPAQQRSLCPAGRALLEVAVEKGDSGGDVGDDQGDG